MGIAHTLLIPVHSRFRITPAVSPSVDTLPNFARKYGAIAVINGGFFDPENRKSTSHAIVQSQSVADPQQNDRLMQNPNLAPYLDQILNRTEFRHYTCGQATQYEITLHRAPIPAPCRLIDALGAGPQLLPTLTLEPEGFLTIVNGETRRDPLGANQPNARSAIGLTHDGSILWVMVAQTPKNAATGISLPALATWMKTLGVETAMNLDGGSSASLFYQGNTWYGKVDDTGNFIQRPVKSVLLVQAL
ncbi:MAG: phosphodiester glycosidase family protein [Scytolyngbya sp. HA4215-MV1]|nr:phosphodiester glycosidase family protein [Scytolyngbya sp. HA4215-MV1]